MAKNILIAGASGLIGKKLTALLLQQGHEVSHLGRSKRAGIVPSYTWDPKKGTYDKAAIEGVEVVINLAGAGVADRRWSPSRKKEILESRVQSVSLLSAMIEDSSVQTVIGASAIGYYGFSPAGVVEETHPPGSDFLAQVTNAWEDEYETIKEKGKRVINFRIGIVLAEEGGALQEIAKPIRYFAGAPLGSGKQMMSWIHIDDLCMMFLHAIEQIQFEGVYNAVSPNPVSNKQMTKAIAKRLGRPILVPFVPSIILKLLLGEMSGIILNGAEVSSKKIERTGFKFSFETAASALDDLL